MNDSGVTDKQNSVEEIQSTSENFASPLKELPHPQPETQLVSAEDTPEEEPPLS
jgi:hypothetical protein